MSFLQAYYTSCENGLRGSKGFQINAATEGLDPSTLQQVERLGLYVPPVNAPSRPTAEEIAQFPVSLLYHRISDGCALLAQAKYLGTDYSGRFGNYFTHSLVSPNAEQDLKRNGFLPIEMWGSQTWQTSESGSTLLARLDEPRPGGIINLQAVEEFLRENNRLYHARPFLTAVERALSTGRRIVVVADSETVALWIAVASYALPFHLALKLTFNTYVKNPYQSETLIVGTTPDSDFNFAPHEIEHQYFVFDFHAERFTLLPDISNFATEVTKAYRDGHAETVAEFSRFVEQVSPGIQLEELDVAFACHALTSNVAAPGIETSRIVKWCASRLANFTPEQIRSLLSGVMSDGSFNNKVVEACTDLFLAAQKRGTHSEIRRMIERPYLEWLIKDVIAVAPMNVVAEASDRLQLLGTMASDVQPLRLLWMKQVRQTEEPDRLCLLLRLGERLGFLDEPEEMLRHLGKTRIGPLLGHEEVQRTMAQFVNKPAIGDIVFGIGEHLATQVSQPRVFSVISEWLAQPRIFSILAAFATERKDLNLYFRLVGTQANRSPGKADARLNAFWECLTGAKRLSVTLATGDVDNAFNAVWQDSMPTTDEALQLLSILPPEQIKETNIPKRLVDLIATSDVLSLNPKQRELLDSLWQQPLYDTLGEKSSIIWAYNVPIHLPQSGDKLFSEMEATLQFLHKHRELNEELVAKLYDVVAKCLLQIKDIDQHRKLLILAYKGTHLQFISSYGNEVETALCKRSSGRARTVARLFETWIGTENLVGAEPARTLLMKVLPNALKDYRTKELEAVDKGLAHSRNAHLRWIDWREAFQEKGLFPRVKQLLSFRR